MATPNEMVKTGLSTMLHALPTVGRVLSEPPHRAAIRTRADSVDVVILPSAEHADEPLRELALECSTSGAKVLFVLTSTDQEDLAEATTLPADGFLLQNELTTEKLDDALQKVSNGDLAMPETMTRQLLSRVRKTGRSNGTRPVLLTPREHQALTLLAEGLSNKQIARKLGVSEHGAKRHVANVLAKLNSPNRTLAVAIALKEGLIEQPI
ncbi:response regulator transcription factor [Amycolatopsis sp. YIM 10]|uniref:LuxR C-terminal-related transcriptional regulator n=1 Tax=Amycolatopsis sp. YIM 10 TaxID=2653857 RepID=UPI00188322A1|nr:response regulator transcription factor [Amycolatopsis sp. YIM 10]